MLNYFLWIRFGLIFLRSILLRLWTGIKKDKENLVVWWIMRMFKSRIISAAVMMSVFLLCFFVLPPIFFRILIYIITAIAMVELFKLLEHCWVTKKDLQKRIYTISSVLTGLSILIISEFNLLSQSGNENVPSLYRFFFMYGMIIWILPVIPWISKKKIF